MKKFLSAKFLKFILPPVIFIVLLFAFMFGTYKYNCARIANNQKPIFIIKKDAMNDGGTQVYYSLGGQYIFWKKLGPVSDGEPYYNLAGKETHFLFGMIDTIKEGPSVELVKEYETK